MLITLASLPVSLGTVSASSSHMPRAQKQPCCDGKNTDLEAVGPGEDGYSLGTPKSAFSPSQFLHFFHSKSGDTKYRKQTLCVKNFIINYKGCAEREMTGVPFSPVSSLLKTF